VSRVLSTRTGAADGTTSTAAPEPEDIYRACGDYSLDEIDAVWYGTQVQDQRYAVRVCRTECPIRTRDACLEVAMDAERTTSRHHRYGVFGGLTPTDRAALAKVRAANAATASRDAGEAA
jgi:hypothetical protein